MLGAATASALGLAGAAKADTVETVVVTGSRIPQIGLTATSPVTALGQKDIKLDGANSIGNLLSTLPSVVNDGDGQSVNNGSVGVATIDLRNLGTKRTLVLVDGKRLVAADASLNVDTNQIPATMIDRIEVLTGGASAVYGSDAVAGVVNIILKKDFQGIEADSQASLTDHGDGLIHDSSLILGVSSDNGKGNVTIYGEFMHRDAISEADRDFSAHALGATNYTGCASPATHFGGFCFSGSGTGVEGRVKSASLAGPTAGTTTFFTPGGGIAAFDGRSFNFAPFQQLQTQGQRYSFGATGHYQVDEQVDFYTRLTFSDNQVRTQIGPSPMTALFNINCGNPQMSDAVRQAIFGTTPGGTIAAQCATEDPSLVTGGDPVFDTRLVSLARRLSEVGPRIGVNEHSAFQLVGGIKGDLGEGWSYDLSGQYGHTFVSQFLLNDALKGNFQNGLIVDPNTGLCTQDSANCSPMNFFTPLGLTAANVNYIRSNLIVDTYVNQWDMQVNLVGNLDEFGIRSPWAKDPIGVGIGAEYRQEDAAVRPDHNLQIGNLVGNNQIVATSGGFRVGEGYGEMRVPIIQDMEFARDLTFEGSGRFSSYDRAGSTWTWKAGLEWQVIDDIKFRVAAERSVRAPNVSELFTPAGGTSANPGRDPCSALSATTTTAALCIATGVPAASVFTHQLDCPTNQCQGAIGGNPFLKPEDSDSRTLGIVFTPTFIPGLTATVDWYDIKIAGFVTAIPIQTILNSCYSTALNPTQSATNPFCSFIHRDALGTITTTNTGFVVQAEGNIAKNKTDGLDFEVNYDTDLSDWGMAGWGSLTTNWIANWASFNELSVIGYSCVGLWGTQCGEPEPRFKSNLRLTWADSDNEFSVSVKWRHLSGVEFELNQFGFNNTPVLEIPDFDYFDLSGTWAVSDGLELRGGVRNVFDRDPPVTDNNSAPASSINGNTFPGTYDALGRVIFIGATARL
jgi:outer membrane receptor protein involved in Fe transport